jgi:hypothetical protein
MGEYDRIIRTELLSDTFNHSIQNDGICPHREVRSCCSFDPIGKTTFFSRNGSSLANFDEISAN